MRAPNLPVLFHPDCNRRLRNRTESADPADSSAGARGLWRSLALPPVGTFTPPRERGRTEIRPMRLTHISPSHANDFPPAPALCQADGEILHGQRLLWFEARGFHSSPRPSPPLAAHRAVSAAANVTGRECLSVGLTRRFQRMLGGATMPKVKPKARAAHENYHALRSGRFASVSVCGRGCKYHAWCRAGGDGAGIGQRTRSADGREPRHTAP